jgi:type IV pilus assembly protein PilE
MIIYRQNSNTEKGFSLIELIIAVAIVGILSAIAFPSYTQYLEKGRRAECRSGLLRTMQQQERYFTQRNTYVAFTAGSTASAVISYSGEGLAKSACTIAAAACTSATIDACVELEATPQITDSKISNLYFDSSGQKKCALSGSATKVVNTESCWP